MKNVREVELKVFDPDPSHVGRNIVTLDKTAKDSLGVTSGDIIEIEGTKKTAAVIWPARSEDEGKGIIRMDNFIRHNVGVGLGEKVRIRKAEVKEAKKVILAPTQDVRIIASGYDRILKKNFIGRPLVRGDSVWISVFGSGFVYTVVDTSPRGIVKVNDFTQFVLKEQPVKEAQERVPHVAYEDIGGLQEQVQKVREMIELPMRHPELFRRLGIQPPKGVLLYGPPGCGKTLLAKAVANETEAHFITVNAPSLMSKFVGEAEERIRQVFKEAEDNAPSIIFFDEIDAIAPKRDEVVGEVERRVVAQLLASMDGMEARGNVIVIAATNRVNSIDEALRRPGRFDREIEFPVPGKNERKQILQIHTRGMPIHPPFDAPYLANVLENSPEEVLARNTRENVVVLLRKNPKEKEFFKVAGEKEESEVKQILLDKMLTDFAEITHGFVGADLSALTKEAAMKALRRYLPKINLEEETIPTEVLETLEVNKPDFLEALRDVQPSALREVTIEVPNVKWTDVGALEYAKQELKQAVEWPLKNPQAFKRLGIRPPRGVLLYGPPGCGKTLLAKAVATESGANFISVKGPELISMWVGESEKGVRNIFKKARQVSPAIIFFDEVDSIASHRGSHSDSGVGDRVINQLLTELDGIEELKDVVFIAATNRPDLIDPGLLRPGRIDKLIRVSAPDKDARRAVLKVHLKGVPMGSKEEKDELLKELVELTTGFSGADLEGLIREAALIALQESNLEATRVEHRHFEVAIGKLRPSISQETEEAYDEFAEKRMEYKPSYIE
ncbi:MAG: CDC48 family AAA ATPase [Candidatus Diapherotrites archaeon]|uniref:CDC48 family AAA ATPase n=1 Tax=Candidatus Iainarchaeum sp. TaxID=3101447 RepID=A0A8T4L3W6_9ARCH|nr:CDC48 family AAA ATPase [Candidatus Diapherotrites archaeon]